MAQRVLRGREWAVMLGAVQQWPWPGDSREDRAKRVALSYRRLALAIAAGDVADPTAALADLDARWDERGAGWVAPTRAPLDLDAWLTAGEVARLLCIDPQRLRDWARRGHIRTMQAQLAGPRRYCVGDVVSYQRTRRLKCVGALS